MLGDPAGNGSGRRGADRRYASWLRDTIAKWSVRRRPFNRIVDPNGEAAAKNPIVGVEREGLLAHSAIGTFQLLLPLLALLALGLADDERTRADVLGMVEIGLGLFGHDERNLREVDLNP